MSTASQLLAVATIVVSLAAAARGATSTPRGEDERAAAAFAAKDWPRARTAYERLAKDHPESGAVQYRLGTSLLYTGDVAAGRAALERAEKLGWSVPQVAYRLA